MKLKVPATCPDYYYSGKREFFVYNSMPAVHTNKRDIAQRLDEPCFFYMQAREKHKQKLFLTEMNRLNAAVGVPANSH